MHAAATANKMIIVMPGWRQSQTIAHLADCYF